MTPASSSADPTPPGVAIEAAGLRWNVVQRGAGDCVLLIHGTGGTVHTWDALLPLLSQRFRAIALDLPGHGETSYPGFERITCEGVSAMLAEAVAALGVSPVAVIAHSAGAAIMLRAALSGVWPAAARLIGINPALEAAPDAARALMQGAVGDLFRSRPSRWLVRSAARATPVIELLLASTGSRLTPGQERRYVAAFRSGEHAEAAYAMMANWDLLPLRQALSRIQHETLFIVGDRDRWIPPSVARNAAVLMPHARVETIRTGGHLVHEERPAEVAEIVARALGVAPPRPSEVP